MKLELAGTINKLVNSKYLSAKSSESLVFSQTELTIIRSRTGLPVGIPFHPDDKCFYFSSNNQHSFSCDTALHFPKSQGLVYRILNVQNQTK